MRLVAKNDAAQNKKEIQRLLREIVIQRDGGCILRGVRRCGGLPQHAVLQADHLITRANSATFADSRLVVCLCRPCHGGFKQWHKEEYDALVKTILPSERVRLWEACEIERQSHRAHKMDWAMEIIALKKELAMLQSP